MANGICPVCNGSRRIPVSDEHQRYKTVVAGYDAETDTFPCGNCGGQYMFGTPTGQVKRRADGTPCTHRYISETIGNCLHRSTCKHCGDSYTIDSGD